LVSRFGESAETLKADAVPSIFTWTTANKNVKERAQRLTRRRLLLEDAAPAVSVSTTEQASEVAVVI